MLLRASLPVDVGNTLSYRLSGFKNGNIYYFAVAAYSSLDKRIVVLSEVYARPLRKVNEHVLIHNYFVQRCIFSHDYDLAIKLLRMPKRTA